MGEQSIAGQNGHGTAEQRLEALAGTLGDIEFFNSAGKAPTSVVETAARAYLDGLGLAPVAVQHVKAVADAVELCQHGDASLIWRRAEDRVRATLTVETDRLIGQSKAAHLLNEVMRRASDAATPGAARLAAQSDDPEGVKRAAAGAVIHAAYEFALAAAVAVPGDHPFRCKFALFEAGRWPLSVIDNRFYLL